MDYKYYEHENFSIYILRQEKTAGVKKISIWRHDVIFDVIFIFLFLGFKMT